MSLSVLLKGDTHGCYRWPDGRPDAAAERAAVEAGWRYVFLDSAAADEREPFLETCADAFDLPEAAVSTWDGLDACLRGLDLDEPEGVLVVWAGWAALADADPDAFDCAIEVFRDACVAWHDDEVPGAVLLVGDGPDTDLPEL